ncbi:uncharacterized protein LOC116617419 isoform X2 [Nematostella vectensis]|uniref:uncharacterized protein LOC116617419 isoform X2 n=1 Tax=Nematostella vectensis TaxID=45351 RepID=UPI0020773A32|nr:uncharacterized protein LOC116617419 isoform X2 [Nematostella vectensis]
MEWKLRCAENEISRLGSELQELKAVNERLVTQLRNSREQNQLLARLIAEYDKNKIELGEQNKKLSEEKQRLESRISSLEEKLRFSETDYTPPRRKQSLQRNDENERSRIAGNEPRNANTPRSFQDNVSSSHFSKPTLHSYADFNFGSSSGGDASSLSLDTRSDLSLCQEQFARSLVLADLSQTTARARKMSDTRISGKTRRISVPDRRISLPMIRVEDWSVGGRSQNTSPSDQDVNASYHHPSVSKKFL